MNRIQWKDFFREIRRNKGRFFSLLFIVALGCAFYSGIRSSEPDMTASADKYYDETNFCDIRLVSSLGLTDDDLDKVRGMEGILLCEGTKSVELFARCEDSQPVMSVISLGDKINQFTIKGGRLPEKADECFMDVRYMSNHMCKIGDKVTLMNPDKETPEELTEETFTIVGYGTWAWYLNLTRGSASIGDGRVEAFMVLRPEVFTQDYYTSIYATVEGAKDMNGYEDAYDDLVEKVTDRIEGIEDVQVKLRHDQILAEAQDKIQDGKDKIAEGKRKIADGKKELEDGESEYADGMEKYQDGLKQFEDGKKEYQEGLVKLADGKKQYEEGKAAYESGKAELEDKTKEYDEGAKALEEGRKTLADSRKELDAGQKEYKKGLAEYEKSKKLLDSKEKELKSGEKELAKTENNLASQKKQLVKQKAGLKKQREELAAKEPELKKQKKMLTSQRAGLVSQKAELDKQKAEVDKQKTGLLKQKAELEGQKSQLESQRKELADQKSQLESQKKTLQARKTSLESQKKEAEAQKAGLEDQKDKLEDQRKSLLASRPSNPKTEAEKALAAKIDSQVKEIDDQLTQLDRGISQASSSLDQIKEGLAQIKDGLDEIDQGLPQLEAGIREIDRNLPKVTAGLKEVKAGLKEINKGLSDLNDGIKQVSDGIDQIDQGLKEIKSGQKELTDGLDQLDAGISQIDQGLSQIAAGQKEIDKKKKTLASGKKELKAGKKELEKGAETLERSKNQLASGEKEYAKGLAAFEANERKLEEGKKLLDEGKKELDEAKKELDKAQKEIQDSEKLLKEAGETIKEKEGELKDAEQELKDARKELDDGWETYRTEKKKADRKIKKAEKKIADAEADLEKLGDGEWYILTRNEIQTCVEYGMDAERIGKIATVFPVIFFLVAALVCLTTMTRMIEEERMLIGTMKALGYSKLAIISKYLMYAFIATISGGLLGVLGGSKLLPYVIMKAYGMLYTNVPYLLMPYQPVYCITAIGMALLCTVGAAWAACYKELLSTPASLMRPPAPKSGRKIILERIPLIWNHLNFSMKSTIRNLFRYKKRFIMTVLGIGGCMAILLVSYGLHDSIAAIVDNQYKRVWTYSMYCNLEENMDPADKEGLRAEILAEEDQVADAMLARNLSLDISRDGVTKNTFLYVVESTDKMKGFLDLHDRVTHEAYQLTDQGVILSEKLGRMLGAGPGDTVTLKISDTEYRDVTVTACAENYLNNYVYMTPELYREVYGEEVIFNECALRYKEALDEDLENALAERLLLKDGLNSVNLVRELQKTVDNMMNALNLVVWVLIIAAGLLVFVVSFNLNNINISERRRELASLKVLGFYDMEVAMYVYRENIFLTLFGIVAGLFMGTWLHRYVITTLEVEMIMFGRNITGSSYIYSSLLTVVFSVLVNVLMYYKLRQIDMVESLKSVE